MGYVTYKSNERRNYLHRKGQEDMNRLAVSYVTYKSKYQEKLTTEEAKENIRLGFLWAMSSERRNWLRCTNKTRKRS